MSNKIAYLNISFKRSVGELLGQRSTFVTPGGIFTGTISSIDENFAYELNNVVFRPAGSFELQIKMEICEIYAQHIVASLPVLD